MSYSHASRAHPERIAFGVVNRESILPATPGGGGFFLASANGAGEGGINEMC